MRCEICGRPTDWDSSVGKENYIVCNPCFYKLCKRYEHKNMEVLDFLFKIADVREERGDDC